MYKVRLARRWGSGGLLARKRLARRRLHLLGRRRGHDGAVEHLEPGRDLAAHAHVEVGLGGLDVEMQVVAEADDGVYRLVELGFGFDVRSEDGKRDKANNARIHRANLVADLQGRVVRLGERDGRRVVDLARHVNKLLQEYPRVGAVRLLREVDGDDDCDAVVICRIGRVVAGDGVHGLRLSVRQRHKRLRLRRARVQQLESLDERRAEEVALHVHQVRQSRLLVRDGVAVHRDRELVPGLGRRRHPGVDLIDELGAALLHHRGEAGQRDVQRQDVLLAGQHGELEEHLIKVRKRNLARLALPVQQP
mmetsp:Transcript_7269/g.23688  ORF Transcript_7269/g.23688 Transcript_7269/m.23688 type:complete len:307 (-) Transcript_7269:95-1015(-)